MRRGESGRSAEELAQQVRAYEVAMTALDAEMEAVEQGTHPEYLRRCKRLQHAKDQREDRARRAYDMSVQTLERLQELEMVSAPRDETPTRSYRRRRRANRWTAGSSWRAKRCWTRSWPKPKAARPPATTAHACPPEVSDPRFVDRRASVTTTVRRSRASTTTASAAPPGAPPIAAERACPSPLRSLSTVAFLRRQSPASVLLDKGLPDSVMEQDFQTIEAAANTKRQRLS
ncbi:MAG: hypothetical protein AAF368_19215 [Planctomycetota bacterium]